MQIFKDKSGVRIVAHEQVFRKHYVTHLKFRDKPVSANYTGPLRTKPLLKG